MSFLKLTANAVAVLTQLGLVVLAVAGLSGIGHRWVDILAQFTTPALTAAVVGLILCLLLRLWPAAIAGGASCLLLIVAVWPQWFAGQSHPLPDAPVVTVYSANLWARNTDVEAMKRSIAAADADILVLIELGKAPNARLDELLAGYPHRQVTRMVDRPSGAARSVIASRYPLVDGIDGRPGLHSVGAVIDSPLGRLSIVGVHLTRPWPFQYQWGQITQAMAIAEIRADLIGPVIVAGDFNSVSSARIGRQMKAETGLIPAPAFAGTWPSALPAVFGMTIDQVYRSPDLALTQRRLGRRNGSDHRPVITTFTRAAD